MEKVYFSNIQSKGISCIVVFAGNPISSYNRIRLNMIDVMFLKCKKKSIYRTNVTMNCVYFLPI